MKRKNSIIIVLVIALLCFLGGMYIFNDQGNADNKNVTINIYNGEEMIGTITTDTNVGTLDAYLTELSNNNEIVVASENGAYGYYLTGLGIDELMSEDPTKSIFWVFESTTNTSCVEAGYCDSANLVVLEDADIFDFILTDFSNGN